MKYTWQVTAINIYGKREQFNVKDPVWGIRRRWYKTFESARKAMFTCIGLATYCGSTEIKWVLYECDKHVDILVSNE